MKNAFVDTNVVVYLHDRDEPEKRALARALFDDGGLRFVISTQVLIEFYTTVARRLPRPLPPDAARAVVEDLTDLVVVSPDARLVLEAIDLAARHQLSPWDGMILRAAIVGGCDTLLTEDLSDGAVYDGVRVVNPFADAA